jgi:hypothetical protein
MKRDEYKNGGTGEVRLPTRLAGTRDEHLYILKSPSKHGKESFQLQSLVALTDTEFARYRYKGQKLSRW